MSPTLKATLIERWKSEGFDAKLGWYRAMTENVNWEHEKKIASFELSIPVLFIGGSRDAACPARLGDLFTRPLCKDYTGVVIDSCHWMLREKPVQWLETVKPWLLSRF
jgi:soluble epoxide hydrolase/lipid-phosphate phosphatase